MSKSSKKPEAAPAGTPAAEVSVTAPVGNGIGSVVNAGGETTALEATSVDVAVPGTESAGNGSGEAASSGEPAAGADTSTMEAPSSAVESSVIKVPVNWPAGQYTEAEILRIQLGGRITALENLVIDTAAELTALKAWCSNHTHMGAGAQPDSAP